MNNRVAFTRDLEAYLMKTFRYLVGTLLAWLGLAGLADGFIVWQSWFDQGVMLHWQSMKAWISVVLLGWLPFRGNRPV